MAHLIEIKRPTTLMVNSTPIVVRALRGVFPQSFRDLARDPANQTRGVLDLAFEAGFSSKATFYRYFRAREGVTPNDFRAALSAAGLN